MRVPNGLDQHIDHFSYSYQIAFSEYFFGETYRQNPQIVTSEDACVLELKQSSQCAVIFAVHVAEKYQI